MRAKDSFLRDICLYRGSWSSVVIQDFNKKVAALLSAESRRYLNFLNLHGVLNLPKDSKARKGSIPRFLNSSVKGFLSVAIWLVVSFSHTEGALSFRERRKFRRFLVQKSSNTRLRTSKKRNLNNGGFKSICRKKSLTEGLRKVLNFLWLKKFLSKSFIYSVVSFDFICKGISLVLGQ